MYISTCCVSLHLQWQWCSCLWRSQNISPPCRPWILSGQPQGGSWCCCRHKTAWALTSHPRQGHAALSAAVLHVCCQWCNLRVTGKHYFSLVTGCYDLSPKKGTTPATTHNEQEQQKTTYKRDRRNKSTRPTKQHKATEILGTGTQDQEEQ